jgi:hypothetical protein
MMKATELLHDLGQGSWLDNITRDLLNSGTLKHYVADGQKGELQRSTQHRWDARCQVKKKMAGESPPRRGKGREALGWVVV